MRYFKIVLNVGNQVYKSPIAIGLYGKRYALNSWTITDKFLKDKGFGLCVYGFPNKVKDKEVLSFLHPYKVYHGQDLEIFEVEVKEEMPLPESRLQSGWFDIPFSKLSDVLSSYDYRVTSYWPIRTKMFGKVKLLRRLGS